MSDQQEPFDVHTLRRIWRSPLPDDAPWSPMVFARSGELIATGTTGGADGHSRGSLTLFDARTGGVVRQIADDWQVYALAFSPDSQLLATSEGRWSPVSHNESRVRILDVATFTERCRYTGHLEATSSSLCFNHDGTWVAAQYVTYDDPGPVAYVFDATNGAERWRRHTPISWRLTVAPDSRSIALDYNQVGIVVLDALTGAERLRIRTPSDVWRLAYSPDSRWIIAGCEDGSIRVFDAGSGAEAWWARLATDPKGSIVAVAVSDDAQWVAAISTERIEVEPHDAGLLGVYDLARGTLKFPPVQLRYHLDVMFSPTLRHIVANAAFGRTDPGTSMYGLTVINGRTGVVESSSSSAILRFAIAPDGSSIAGTDSGFIDMYDLGVEVSRFALDANLTSVTMSPPGTPLVAVADTSSAVTIVDAATGIPLGRKPIPGIITSIVFADHGQAVVAGGSDGVRLFSIVGTRAWKVDDIGQVNALAVTRSAGEWIATAAGKTVRLLSSADGQNRWPSPTAHPHTVTRIASSADGTWIATGCLDRNTRILDADTGTETFRIEGDGRVLALAFMPDGSLLATANEDGNVVLIDAAAATELSRITRLFACTRIAFSADGPLLATAWDDNTVSIYDLTTVSSPQEIQRLALTAPVSGLAFNPAEPTVAVATEGASVVVYDAHDGIELVRILQPAPVSQFAFSADGALIATASDGDIVQVWTSGLPPSDV